jgi:hypothetical protein
MKLVIQKGTSITHPRAWIKKFVFSEQVPVFGHRSAKTLKQLLRGFFEEVTHVPIFDEGEAIGPA